MKATLYSSNFSTQIGRIHYIWGNPLLENNILNHGDKNKNLGILIPREEKTPINNTNSCNDINIYFLSNNRKSFETFKEKLQAKMPEIVILHAAFQVIESEVKAYLEKKLKEFSIKPAFLISSALQKKVWETIMEIPYGKVASYKELAESAGYPNAWRAAGTATGLNPVMLIVPCHRIIKSDGSIGQYGGGEKIKEILLDLEQN